MKFHRITINSNSLGVLLIHQKRLPGGKPDVYMESLFRVIGVDSQYPFIHEFTINHTAAWT